MRTLILCLLCSLACAADLPTDAQTLIDKEGVMEASAKGKYDTEVAKLRADLIPKLQKAQDAATKKGDLDGAMAIKAALTKLGDPKAKAAAPTLVGQWSALWDRGTVGANLAHETWVFNEDGTCVNGQTHGQWKPKADGFEIRWEIGFTDTIKTFTDSGTSATAVRSNEKTISLKKM